MLNRTTDKKTEEYMREQFQKYLIVKEKEVIEINQEDYDKMEFKDVVLHVLLEELKLPKDKMKIFQNLRIKQILEWSPAFCDEVFATNDGNNWNQGIYRVIQKLRKEKDKSVQGSEWKPNLDSALDGVAATPEGIGHLLENMIRPTIYIRMEVIQQNETLRKIFQQRIMETGWYIKNTQLQQGKRTKYGTFQDIDKHAMINKCNQTYILKIKRDEIVVNEIILCLFEGKF